MAKYTVICRGVNNNGTPCDRIGDCARGYCSRCYRVLKAHCVANGSWPAERGVEIPKRLEPFSYEGDQQALIESLQKQEQKKSQEQDNA
jgi:hypothetical protein